MRLESIIFILVLLFVILSCLTSCSESNQKITKDQVDAQIRKEIPIGTNFDDVQTYLQKTGYEFGWFERDAFFYAKIRNVNKGFIVIEDIQIIIHMDNQRKVKSIDVRSVFTGP
jgi:hypothetical protein